MSSLYNWTGVQLQKGGRLTSPSINTIFFLSLHILKGQCHEIFDFWFFSWISFPQASEYTSTAISNFFENSRRYSRLKVHHRCQRHRWQMEKIFKQKNFNNFVWAPLGSRGNIYIHFCLQVHFKVSAAWYCSHYRHRWQICRRCRWYRWQFATGVVDTGGKFAAGIVDTGGKFATGVNSTRGNGGKICRQCRWYRWQICRRCRWYRRQFATGVINTGGKFATGVVDTGGAPWLANISANFRKNSKRS